MNRTDVRGDSLQHAGFAALERVVEGLADGYTWNWTRMMSQRDAADATLDVLAQLGLIEQIEHPLGGTVWRVGKRLFGRTDAITNRRFTAILRQNDPKLSDYGARHAPCAGEVARVAGSTGHAAADDWRIHLALMESSLPQTSSETNPPAAQRQALP